MSIQKIFTKKLTILSNFEDNDDVLLVLLNSFCINFFPRFIFLTIFFLKIYSQNMKDFLSSFIIKCDSYALR